MGILRTDRVSGLGGANAITGSVFFPQNSYINVEPDSGFDLSGDFTVEMWVYNLPGPKIADYQRQISSKGYYTAGNDGNWYFGFNQHSNNILFYSYDGTGSAEFVGGTCTSNLDEWYHIAASRSGSTLKLFVNGVEEASGTLSKGLDDGGNNGLFIGGISSTLGTNSHGDHYGYTSNIRIIKGRALYTAAFTPPAFELNQTSDTTLLCCQSSGNVLQEKTGKILSINNHYGNTNSQGVIATRFTPNSPVGFSTTTDVGTQFGSTFDGVTTFDSQAYFVPPGGNTRERNRGRGLFAGGDAPINFTISSIEIQSQGNATDFGDLTQGRLGTGSVGSSTRGVISSGYTQPNNGNINIIDFVTIANRSNATDFGDSTQARHESGASSSQTRGLFGGGTSPSLVDTIDFVTIATAGDASDFGNLTQARRNVTGVSSPTRSVFMGGRISGPTESNVIDFVTIASTGDATDFGDLTAARGRGASVCSSTRGIMCGGETPTAVNTIDFITIASAGNATDFGDCITIVSQGAGGASNKTRGAFCVGYVAPAYTNAIQFVTIATTGNSVDFGDNTVAGGRSYGFSDSHGGLS